MTGTEGDSQGGGTRRSRSGGRQTSPGSGDKTGPGDTRATPVEAMRSAVQQLEELLGRAPDSVSAVRPKEDGWEADVEVVEVARVPDTTSVMASYRVTLDGGGELLSYERTRRYTRAQTESRR
ncbi:gas vesicle protein GvpO [Streptomyces sp. NPDC003860]